MAVQKITIDSMVNGWMAPSLGDAMAPADTPLDIVFTTPSDWASADPAKHYGAAHFMWGDFEKVGADGLIWHTDGLRPGRYDWMRDAMPKWGTGSLVVAQRIDIDKNSHADTHALPYLPADISFGDVSSEGMGCDRSIAFLTRIFAQTSPDPLVWHTDGLVPGRYDWKCWMDECHYGTLVADARCPAGGHRFGPPGLRDGGAEGHACRPGLLRRKDDVLADHPLHDGGRLHEDEGISGSADLYSGGLAPGSYEWECWMGPQCHHGTVVVGSRQSTIDMRGNIMSKCLRVILMVVLVAALLAGAGDGRQREDQLHHEQAGAVGCAAQGPGVHGLGLHHAEVDGVEVAAPRSRSSSG